MVNVITTLKKAFLFIFLAIPGAFLGAFSGIFLVMEFSTPEDKLPARPFTLACLFVAGILLTMIGLGRTRQPLYGLVFVTIPASVWLVTLVNPTAFGGTLPFLAAVGGSAYFVYGRVDDHYKKKHAVLKNT